MKLHLLLFALVSTFCGCAFLSEAQQSWLKDNARPFETTKPGSDFADLAFLKEFVGDAEIVGLGPGMRGIMEFLEIKHRIVEYLAVNKGFNILAMEIGMAEGTALNGYIHGNKDFNISAILGNDRYRPLYSREAANLIEWMREYNTSGKGNIEIMGYGMEFMASAADSVLDFLYIYDSTYAEKAASIYRAIKDQIFGVKNQKFIQKQSKIEYPSSQYAELAFHIRDHMQVNAAVYRRAATTSLEAVRAIQYANVVLQTTILQLTNLKSTAFRDSCMAANIKWIKDHMPSGSKLILWSDAAHLGNKEWATSTYLKEWYGNDNYLTVDFKFNKGSYYTGNVTRVIPTYSNTLEWGLHLAGIPRYFLDLGKASRDDAQSKWLFRDHLTRHLSPKPRIGVGAIADLYDAVIYIDTVIASANY
jgi:erythromycin esterase